MFENFLFNLIAITIAVVVLGIAIIKKVAKLIIYALAIIVIIFIALPLFGVSLF